MTEVKIAVNDDVNHTNAEICVSRVKYHVRELIFVREQIIERT